MWVIRFPSRLDSALGELLEHVGSVDGRQEMRGNADPPLSLPAAPGLEDSDTVTDEHSWGWRPPTFLGLLELSGPGREHQFGPDSKFSMIRRNAVFTLLCLQARGRAQGLESPIPRTSGAALVASTLPINATPHLPLHSLHRALGWSGHAMQDCSSSTYGDLAPPLATLCGRNSSTASHPPHQRQLAWQEGSKALASPRRVVLRNPDAP